MTRKTFKTGCLKEVRPFKIKTFPENTFLTSRQEEICNERFKIIVDNRNNNENKNFNSEL